MKPEGSRSYTHNLPCAALDDAKRDRINPPNSIQISVSHDSNRQCFTVSVSPVNLHDGMLSVVLSKFKFANLGAGRGSEKRFNQKKLSTMATVVEQQILTKDYNAQVWTLINQVLAENDLKLVEEEAAKEVQAA